MKTAAVPAQGVTGADVAKAVRKMKDGVQVATYFWKSKATTFTVWSLPGSKGAVNTHQLPRPFEEVEVLGDLIVTASGSASAESWIEFYTEMLEATSTDEEGNDNNKKR